MVKKQIKGFEKRKIINFIIFNGAIPGILVIGIFLVLPSAIQKSLSTLLYIYAVIAGLLIGNLIAKIYFLKQKLTSQYHELNKKHENLQSYIGNVVHDLRTPAAAINMISELLKDELTEIDPNYKQLISSMNKSSTTMLDRICCILDNARAQQIGRFEKMTAGNPYELIKMVIQKHEILAIEKNIEFELKLRPTCPDVYYDNDALDSVISNLISNAIKYSNHNTKITISNCIENEYVIFSVKDEGLGMTKDDLTKVFGRYTKLSARPTSGEDSSGLGLSIVKELIEKMNGTVKAESKGRGKGTTLSFSLSTLSMEKKNTA